jgi:hypothetical protein
MDYMVNLNMVVRKFFKEKILFKMKKKNKKKIYYRWIMTNKKIFNNKKILNNKYAKTIYKVKNKKKE